MIIFAIILYILLVVVLGASALLYLSPILIGLVIIGIINGISKSSRGRLAPVWWDIATVAMTIVSTAMLWKDINSDSVDTGPQPFIILLVYGFISLFAFAAFAAIRQSKEKSSSPKKKVKITGATVKAQGYEKTVSTDDCVVQQSSRLSRVRKNLKVEQDVFRRYGMSFKCNLIEEYDTLQLNFELSNTRLLASKIDKDTELTIKANVYDARGNLLCVEEVWIEYSQLRRDYAADYFYFTSESMGRAFSMKVYALDPTEEYDDDDYDEFEEEDDFDEDVASIAHIPPEFIERVRSEYESWHDDEMPAEFVLSVYNEYKNWQEDTVKGLRRSNTNPSGKEYDWKLKETWEDYPEPDYEAMHTYCQVAFDESGKTFYYRTRNPELQVGDTVYVPVGYRYQKRIGKIVSIEEYVGRDAPYPLEKTKHIIGKVE